MKKKMDATTGGENGKGSPPGGADGVVKDSGEAMESRGKTVVVPPREETVTGEKIISSKMQNNYLENVDIIKKFVGDFELKPISTQ